MWWPGCSTTIYHGLVCDPSIAGVLLMSVVSVTMKGHVDAHDLDWCLKPCCCPRIMLNRPITGPGRAHLAPVQHCSRWAGSTPHGRAGFCGLSTADISLPFIVLHRQENWPYSLPVASVLVWALESWPRLRGVLRDYSSSKGLVVLSLMAWEQWEGGPVPPVWVCVREIGLPPRLSSSILSCINSTIDYLLECMKGRDWSYCQDFHDWQQQQDI